MKSLEEILKSKQKTPDRLSPQVIVTEVTDNAPVPDGLKDAIQVNPDDLIEAIEGIPVIPEYMRTEAGAVGYPDDETQAEIYRMAVTGVLPISGKSSILDIGCGRADLFFYIKNQLRALGLTYLGYEMNPLLSQISSERLNLEDYANIVEGDFLTDVITPETWDYVFIIGSLNTNYGWGNDWEQFENILKKSLDVAIQSVTMILLNDTGGNEGYISFPIPKLTEKILPLNHPFTIEYGQIQDVYKLTIQKETIY